MSLYTDIEAEIVARLTPFKAQGFNVLALPEVQADYEKPFLNGRITVAYHSSEFDKPQSTEQISQWEEIRVIVGIEARSLRGTGKGIYDMMALVRKYLIGFIPTDCERMWAKEAGLKKAEYENNVWTYYAIFCTKALAVEDYTETLIADESTLYTYENTLTGADFSTENP
jgi:hypothetical protein